MSGVLKWLNKKGEKYREINKIVIGVEFFFKKNF